MVVIHEYTHTPPAMEEKPEPAPEDLPKYGETISEEKAFWVGLSVITMAVVLILVVVVGRVVWSHRQVAQKSPENQVLGTQSSPGANQPLEINQNQAATNTNKTITTGGEEYTVQSGETLASIGAKYNVDWHKIAQINKITEPYTVITGQKIIIPKE